MKHPRILFIHHSTGGNLIKEGRLRAELRKINPDIELWDHSYNLFPVLGTLVARFTHLKGLSDAKGHSTGKDYRITLSNNSPKEYAEIFSRDPKDPTLTSILSYDIIAFKNCYPTTRIKSNKQLIEDISYFSAIRDAIQRFPKKQFILVTPPPARRETTNAQDALRARQLVSVLNSLMFIQEVKNLHIFDFFNLLADEHGYLKKAYCRPLPWDSHPNEYANQTIAPIFTAYLAELATQ
jgi:hypothetical protein